MKVGIITFHFVPNYGAVLQCYALQTFLESQGYEVEIIDYRPGYHTVRYSTRKNPFVYTRWYWKRMNGKNTFRRVYLAARSFARCIHMNIQKTDQTVNRMFESFVQANLRLTRKYTSLEQLREKSPETDVYISGSDQVWNPELLDQAFDPAYFLDFGTESVTRISYAVSMGKELGEHDRMQLKMLCAKMNAVSIREDSELAIKAIGRDVHICIDPTFLLDSKSYTPAESQIVEQEPYIFVYGFETTDGIQSAVNIATDRYGCRVINGSPHRVKLQGDVESIRNYGPDRFLTFIKNAQCVVTNSFHGTAFSIIYRKDFITVSHTTRGKRMTDLLEKLGLTCRLWGSEAFLIDGDIDYDLAYDKLMSLRKHSTEYLRSSMAGLREEDIP